MPLIKWHDAYSVKNEILDNQHKSIFNLLNSLYDSCMTNTVYFTYKSILDELISDTMKHFATEEKHLKEIGYGNIEEHLKEHREFENIMNNVFASEPNNYDNCKELLVFVADFILHHVIVIDRNYSE